MSDASFGPHHIPRSDGSIESGLHVAFVFGWGLAYAVSFVHRLNTFLTRHPTSPLPGDGLFHIGFHQLQRACLSQIYLLFDCLVVRHDRMRPILGIVAIWAYPA